MNSLAAKRRERGEITQADINPFLSISPDEFLRQSKIPVELEQAIDVIGHIVYTGRLDIDSGELIQTAVKFSLLPMVRFKITRCLSGFRDDEARQFLYKQLRSDNVGLQLEAARSLILSGMNSQVDGYELPEKVTVFIRQLKNKLRGRQ